MRLSLHSRVRLAMWLPGLAAAVLAVWALPLPLALGAAAVLAAALLLWGEPVVQAVRRRDQVTTAPSVAPEPAPDPHQALARALDEGGVTVLYRPLRTLPGMRLCGVAAELRWRHPLAGLLPPSEWPAPLQPALAERLLDRWLAEACAQFVRWVPRLDAGDPATLWLTLPPVWLDSPALDAALERAFTASGLAPGRLRLRLSPQPQGRHALLPPAALRLQARGIGLAAEGLGEGATSLAQLHDLPVQAVCLDRSFVERAVHSAPQRLVVEATARLAASLGMLTLADGIDAESQVPALGAMGCQLGLGEACGPWLEAADWSARWAETHVAGTGTDAAAV